MKLEEQQPRAAHRASAPPASNPAPSSREIAPRVAIPEIKALRDLRASLARGGLPAPSRRTPEDHARIAGFRLLGELLRLFEQYRQRVENGERCRIVEREHACAPGQLLIELAIEAES